MTVILYIHKNNNERLSTHYVGSHNVLVYVVSFILYSNLIMARLTYQSFDFAIGMLITGKSIGFVSQNFNVHRNTIGSGLAIFRMKKIEIYRHHDTIL